VFRSESIVVYLGFFSLSYFLGIEVDQTNDGYYLSQHRYTQDLISRSGLTDTHTAATPMELHLQLRPSDGTPLEGYHSLSSSCRQPCVPHCDPA